MKSAKFVQWKGFEIAPDGCLLDQVIDLTTDMGIAYERSCGFYKDYHVHERLMLIFPRENCKMEVKEKRSQITHKIDSKYVLVVPKSIEHDDLGTTSIYDTLALYPSIDLIKRLGAKEGFSSEEIAQFQSSIKKIKRNQWLDQLLQQYFFQRLIAKRVDKLSFLEENIFTEVLKLYFEVVDSSNEKMMAQDQNEGVTGRAIRFIESNLFHDLNLTIIAKNANASVPTLLRHFKRDVLKTPYVYIKERRMLEALNLLKSGEHSVSDIAILVGYQNLGAFSDAFRSIYKKAPSHFKNESL